MDFSKLLKARQSIRKFNSKKPDWRDILEAIDATRYIPTAGGNNSMKFIFVENKDHINKIADACQQSFVSTAHYVVVACTNPSRLISSYEEKGQTYAHNEAGAAIQNFLLKIEELGLSTCWVGHFDEEEIKRPLKIPAGVNVEAVLPIGFEFEKKRTKKAPIELDRILYFGTYGNSKMWKPEGINA